jgi:DNA-binding CsgD family transcriptional regulator/GAF domain-containing protein
MPESDLKALLNLAAKLGPHPAKNIESILSETCKALNCRCTAFGCIEDGRQRIRFPFTCNLPKHPSAAREAARKIAHEISSMPAEKRQSPVSSRQIPIEELLPSGELKGFLGYPVQLDGVPSGALLAFRATRRPFTPADKRLIALMAKALAVQDAWLKRERSLQRRAILEKRLEEISSLAMEVRDPAKFLERGLALLGDTIGADAACWYELDAGLQTLTCTARWMARGRRLPPEAPLSIPVRTVPWGAGRLMDGHLLRIDDTLALPHAAEVGVFKAYGIRAALGIPLFLREEFFGFMGLEEYDEPKRWVNDDVSALQTGAEIMLRGIENRRLIDELDAHRAGLERVVDERTAELVEVNERLNREVEAHRKTISYLKSRETELRNHNRAFTDLSDRLSLLLQEKGQSIADIEALFADRIRSRFKQAIADKKSIALDANQIETIRHDIDGIASQLKSERFGAYSGLTAAEIKVAELVRLGLSGKEISGVLGISDRTVQVHCLKIREKLGIKNKKLNLKGYLMSL